ncbi:DegT/DnrJ/EryC1/StrS aminotransferase family protein [uncultured Phenylobacterium sp.]|uniref:DegT/DnrJ/EryC1/StrS family aminotransferase n=1 Tax=uncultured Phenylobacterium sp. TaxID=349273 RepID=UPI0025F1B8A9|nr:DegT/DnrJ/EryC1/StrS family aminotransferase [uncultured Phenylobacterium sp.]
MTPSPRIPVAAPVLDGREREYVLECLDTNWISSAGRFIQAFETAFAEACGVRHAVATNNGTTALHLALVALGLGPGDEVIVPTLTYIASANAVTYCGATPVFVDCDRVTFNIDPSAVAAAITPRTRAIMPVHLYGHPVDMDPILALARQHNLYVVEDAAEAVGARYKDRAAGALGDCATFSFFGNKIITTGEGGMVTTDDDALAARMRLYRGQGMDPQRRYWFPVIGYNYRMTNIAAAIGLGQLERLDHHLAARARVAHAYDARLSEMTDRLVLPTSMTWARHAYWMYTVMLTDKVSKDRDQVIAELDALGIESRPVFHPMHTLPPYQESAGGPFPRAEHAGARGLNLPTFGALTAEDIDRIGVALAKVLA